MTNRTGRRGALALVAALALAGCTSFRTDYTAVPAAASEAWRLADVRVDAPATLRVSEAKGIFPRGDIVWREDPPGDRRAQVAAIVADAARSGLAGLQGTRPVVVEVTLARFHALTFEAEGRLNFSGVHDIEFTARVTDAATGEVLAGPDYIEASLPAMVGPAMVAARARGETQKSQITAHLEKVFAGWLGLGPDPREKFRRLGG